MSKDSSKYDYIIVGSGAGGGTLAARLAESGKRVLLLEAGGDPLHLKGADPVEPDNQDRLPQDYHVPVFHAISSENNGMKWDFFVDHYSDPARKKRDPKYSDDWSQETEPPVDPVLGVGPARPDLAVGENRSDTDGILYPRAGTLGGCTAHNAMITVYPHNSDWDYIETLTSDSSWSHKNMRKYFQRLENCHHRPGWRLLRWLGINPTKHGFSGWLHTEAAIPVKAVAGDKALIKTLEDSVEAALETLSNKWQRFLWQLQGKADPNDWRLVEENSTGLRYPPLATRDHRRNGTRDRVRDVEDNYSLEVRLNALATRVLFDGTRAIGVEYLSGEKLYRAHHNPSNDSGDKEEVYIADGGEVILSGGAFNSPQLLMLSGIGPAEELRNLGIEPRVDLAGVGKNLQDRYEVGIVNKMAKPWKVLKDAKFSAGDP